MKKCCFMDGSTTYTSTKKLETELTQYVNHLLEKDDLCFLFKTDAFNSDCLEIIAKIRHFSKFPEKIKIHLIEHPFPDINIIQNCDVCFIRRDNINFCSSKTLAYIKVVKNLGLLIYFI